MRTAPALGLLVATLGGSAEAFADPEAPPVRRHRIEIAPSATAMAVVGGSDGYSPVEGRSGPQIAYGARLGYAYAVLPWLEVEANHVLRRVPHAWSMTATVGARAIARTASGNRLWAGLRFGYFGFEGAARGDAERFGRWYLRGAVGELEHGAAGRLTEGLALFAAAVIEIGLGRISHPNRTHLDRRSALLTGARVDVGLRWSF